MVSGQQRVMASELGQRSLGHKNYGCEGGVGWV